MIDGNLKSEGNVRIDCIVNGNVSVFGNLTLGEKAEISGNVTSAVLIIGGKITGDVSAAEKLILHSGAVLKGDIITNSLVIEDGASFEGRCSKNSE